MRLICLKYKALSPLHIGYGRRLGIINQTRYFIPGINIWAGLSVNLVQKLMRTYNSEVYVKAGNFIKENFLITNFYPVIDNSVCLPQFKKEGFYYGPYSKYEFESIVLDSYTSTALQMKTAEEGSLHEIEFLKNKIKVENIYLDLQFEGYIGIKNDQVLQEDLKLHYEDRSLPLLEIVKDISIGGERKYGFGRLTLSENPQKTEKFWEEFKIEGSKITIDKDKATPFYIKITNNFNKRFIGDIEPIISRLWIDSPSNKTGSGQEVKKYGVCIVPGSLVKKEIRIDLSTDLSAFGIAVIVD